VQCFRAGLVFRAQVVSINLKGIYLMTFLLLLPKLLIAGGSSFLGTLELPPSPDMINHTLAGEKIPAREVVCRDRWGTPMLPDGKGGYSIIAPIDKGLIAQSLWIPPISGSRPTPTPTPPVSLPVLGAPVQNIPGDKAGSVETPSAAAGIPR
jgi:hypothetical protein